MIKYCIALFLILLVGGACSIKKAIPPNERIVHKVKIKGAPAEVKDGLYNLVEEKPNRRIFGIYRFHLRMYLLSQKFKWLNKKSKKSDIWEPPVLYTQKATDHSLEKMESYMKNQGYFNAKVRVKQKFKGKKKVKVTYEIHPFKPYKILSVDYLIEDRLIDSLVKKDKGSSELYKNKTLRTEDIAYERERITEMLKTKGFYSFSREYIYFNLDSTLAKKKVAIEIGIQNPELYEQHLQYTFGNIYVQPDYSFKNRLLVDTLELANGFYILGSTQPQIDDLIYTYTYFKKGDLYDVSAIQSTLKKLRDIQQFKYIDIEFKKSDNPEDSLALDVFLKMTPYTRYEWQGQAEVNTSEEKDNRPSTPSRLYGMATSLTFRDLNFRKRAVQMETQARLAAELNALRFPLSLYNYEFTLSNNYFFPKPFLRKLIPEKYVVNLKNSSLGFKWLWERNTDFSRTTGSANLGYLYQKGKAKHLITPMEFSYVQANLLSNEFKNLINSSQNLFLRNLFTNHTISATRWNMYYSTKPISSKYKRYWEFQFTVFEAAGNLYGLLARGIGSEVTGEEAVTYNRSLLGMNFFQYVKGDYDVRYHQKTFFGNEMVYRAYLGLIAPYGNTPNSVPFEKRYYSGGSNSIRGWNVRQLGPGSYVSPTTGELVYLQSGDIKLEANFEYRFKLSSLLEMALFADVGNVWNHPNNNFQVPGGAFSFGSFYKQLALAGGLGTRLDFNYFIFRLDFAIPMRDPSFSGRGRESWFPDTYYQNPRISNILHINFGLGYPF